MINSSVDGEKIIVKGDVNIGIAVAKPDGNLIVPVVRYADKLNIPGIASAINSLADAARNHKLSPDDIKDGTFTITNFGTFKNVMGTPIISQPQVAILATGTIEKKPAVVETEYGDIIVPRHKMYLSLSYDHRIIDGALGGAFLRRVADYLEQFDVKREV
jgi:2-oxoglutarate dehydrogenase E2 component (dihydrolipoamide succinyltransferase)